MKGSRPPPHQPKLFSFSFGGGGEVAYGNVQRDKGCWKVREASWTHTPPLEEECWEKRSGERFTDERLWRHYK